MDFLGEITKSLRVNRNKGDELQTKIDDLIKMNTETNKRIALLTDMVSAMRDKVNVMWPIIQASLNLSLIVSSSTFFQQRADRMKSYH